MRSSSRLLVGLVAGGVALTVERCLRAPVATAPRWHRRNYRDRDVLLSAGPAATAGALVATGCLTSAPGAVLAGGTAAALGLYDDLYGDSHARGLAGHLKALRSGRLTTGMVKLTGMTAAGLVAGTMQRRRTATAVADAALIAGTANLVNLLDLRPGRALKVVTVTAGLLMATDAPATMVATAAAAAAVATLPADLGERAMIGDCGANGLGALLGWCLATGLNARGRAVALVVITGLTLASEKVSFTAVIERTPWLSALDAWGRA